MHLTELMFQAGVDLTSAGDEEITISSLIDHHTLRRLGYKLQLNTWEYVGRGRVTSTGDPSEQGINTEEEEEEEDTAQEESAAPSQPLPSRSSSFHLATQISNLATKSDIAHLRQFMMEQFQLLQATLMSKLESMDSRIQACETHLLHHPRTSSVPHPSSQDPKGKAPMVSPLTSPTISPAPTPHIPSPQPSPSAQKSPPHDPIAISSHSSSSSSSSPSDLQQFELVARTPATPTAQSPTSHSQDSEATPSDPTRFLTAPPPSPPPPPPPPDQPLTHLHPLRPPLLSSIPPHLVLTRLHTSDGRKRFQSQAFPPLHHRHRYFLALLV